MGICLPVMFLGCKQDYLKPTDYVHYVKDTDNGFIERRDTMDVLLEAFYQPPEYFSLIHMEPGKIDQSLLATDIARNSNFYHFNLKIASASGKPIDEILKNIVTNDDEPFDTKKQHMLYNMQNYFFLATGKDSLPCTFYHAQLTGKIDNAYHFALAFEADSASQKQSDVLRLIYTDSIWLQSKFDFAFNKIKINQSPGLKL